MSFSGVVKQLVLYIVIRPAQIVMAIFAAVMLASCASSTILSDVGASDNAVLGDAGLLPLQTFNGNPLPAEFAPVPPQVPGADTVASVRCYFLIGSGSLTLREQARTFSLIYTVINSCTNAKAYDVPLEGNFTNNSDTLSFVVPAVIPPDYHFTGTVGPKRVTVKFPDETLVFGK
jgi:hypothetical protein